MPKRPGTGGEGLRSGASIGVRSQGDLGNEMPNFVDCLQPTATAYRRCLCYYWRGRLGLGVWSWGQPGRPTYGGGTLWLWRGVLLELA